ncbi:MAG: hypothetical protein HY681_04530 [Chloroflexi bacterium]|nr:hypothetical protein [Chloroflexota bacterium]
MEFDIDEATRAYFRGGRGYEPVKGVQHIFVAALLRLMEDYGGGGVLHYYRGEILAKLLEGLVEAQQERQVIPDPLALLGAEALEKAREQAGGESAGFIHLAGPPPGWRIPFDQGYQDFVARHGRLALERGARFTSIYEVLYDALQDQGVIELLQDKKNLQILQSLGLSAVSAEEIRERVRPYLDPKRAEEEVGWRVRRWGMVLLTLRPGVSRLTLEPRYDIATNVFRLNSLVSEAQWLTLDTISLPLVFFSAIKQVLRGGRTHGSLGEDALLTPLSAALETHLTGGKPAPPYARRQNPDGSVSMYGAVPQDRLKVPPEVEAFLIRHRDTAMGRGDPFTSCKEVLLDLLGYEEIQRVAREAGVELDTLRPRFESL